MKEQKIDYSWPLKVHNAMIETFDVSLLVYIYIGWIHWQDRKFSHMELDSRHILSVDTYISLRLEWINY